MAEYVGVEPVVQMIRELKPAIIAIYRQGQKRAQDNAIYQATGEPAELAEKFANWAQLVLSGNPQNSTEYKLWSCQKDTRKASKKNATADSAEDTYSKPYEFLFQLTRANWQQQQRVSEQPAINIQQPPAQLSGDFIKRSELTETIAAAVGQALQQKEMEAMRAELKNMREATEDYLDELDELRDELDKKVEPKMTDKARDMMSVVKEFKAMSKEKDSVSAPEEKEEKLLKVGNSDPEFKKTPEYATEQQKKVNRAINLLWQLDDQIGDDLEKLAAIGTADPDKLEYLLKKLRAEEIE